VVPETLRDHSLRENKTRGDRRASARAFSRKPFAQMTGSFARICVRDGALC
jgi:hypothetical protein